MIKFNLATVVLLAASVAHGQNPKSYHTGQLLQMESLQCTVFENPNLDVNANDTTLCQEYVVQGDEVLFHLRPKQTKHIVLLPVGKEVSYRINESRFFLRISGDRKEHEYSVVSMERRERPQAAPQTALKINHLQ